MNLFLFPDQKNYYLNWNLLFNKINLLSILLIWTRTRMKKLKKFSLPKQVRIIFMFDSEVILNA
jgi:hypothetical protein